MGAEDMQVGSVSEGDLSSVNNGLTPQPEGESVSGHAASSEEESPETLANKAREAPRSTAEEGSPPGNEPPLSPTKTTKITRATARLTLDLRRRLDDPDRVWADELDKALIKAQRECSRAANAVTRILWRADGETLDALRKANNFSAKNWPFTKINTYAIARELAPELNTGIASAVSRMAMVKWGDDRWDALVRETRSPPHYRSTMPIVLRAQELRLRQDKGVFRLSLSLRAGRDARIEIPITPRDPRQQADLAKIATGEWKIGDARVEQDRLRPRRWFIRIAYTRFVEKKTGGITAAINRGIRAFLVAATAKGSHWVYDGEDIEAFLKQVQRRRKSYQYASKASSRWGHGRQRTLRPIKPLEDKATRWRETKCQVIARQLARWLDQEGVTCCYVEDFVGIRHSPPEKLEGGVPVWQRIQEWPYHQLLTRLVSCLDELGIETVVVAPQDMSRTCPDCGLVDERAIDRRAWVFKCTAPGCGFKRHLDVTFAMNLRVRGEENQKKRAAGNVVPLAGAKKKRKPRGNGAS